MRDVLERLEHLQIGYYVTGSEALPRYGQPRQSMDIDIVLDITLDQFPIVGRAFEGGYLVNDPIDFGGHLMASIIPTSALGKADLILSRDDAWSRLAMSRRQRWEHPQYGAIWVASLEDLILAKLQWSGGTSELQLRDCRNLVAMNRQSIDWPYLEHWAGVLGLDDLLAQVRYEA